MKTLYENETITGDDFSDIDEIANVEFIDCTIEKVNLFEKKLTDCIFTNCTFSNVNMAMSKLPGTQMNKARFENCKIMGIDFSQCRNFLFEVSFYSCILDFSSFENMKMQNTEFIDCSMKGVDLVGTNLEKSKFMNCNLEDAIFIRTNLKEADLSTAYNFIIPPTQNFLKKAIFSESNLSGLLHEFDIRLV